jgi:hypothetical protein
MSSAAGSERTYLCMRCNGKIIEGSKGGGKRIEVSVKLRSSAFNKSSMEGFF